VGRTLALRHGGITWAAQATEQSFVELLLVISSPIRDFLSIPLMGMVKGGALADSAIKADVTCVVNHFTERGERFPGCGVARPRDRLFEVVTNCSSSFLFGDAFT